jgi:hypothetical protein
MQDASFTRSNCVVRLAEGSLWTGLWSGELRRSRRSLPYGGSEFLEMRLAKHDEHKSAGKERSMHARCKEGIGVVERWKWKKTRLPRQSCEREEAARW